LKNQTNSRSKFGQSPRLYVRVEYETEHFHIGGLQNLVSLSDESDRPLRSITDIVIDVSELISTLSERADRIKTVHIVGDSRLSLVNNNQLDDDDRRFNAGELSQRLADQSIQTHDIDVYSERDLA
jgi:CRISPR-associated protein Csh2